MSLDLTLTYRPTFGAPLPYAVDITVSEYPSGEVLTRDTVPTPFGADLSVHVVAYQWARTHGYRLTPAGTRYGSHGGTFSITPA